HRHFLSGQALLRPDSPYSVRLSPDLWLVSLVARGQDPIRVAGLLRNFDRFRSLADQLRVQEL
ncbi:MAG: hypothetical protein RLZZ435_3872, partial [Cyanobacteriota bacterium]